MIHIQHNQFLSDFMQLHHLKARKFAVQLGCRLSGAIGVLCKMEHKGVIGSAYQEALKLKKMGFRLSDKLINDLSSEITVNSFFSHLELCTLQRLENTLTINFVQMEGQLDI